MHFRTVSQEMGLDVKTASNVQTADRVCFGLCGFVVCVWFVVGFVCLFVWWFVVLFFIFVFVVLYVCVVWFVCLFLFFSFLGKTLAINLGSRSSLGMDM